jgi:geranylgeranyl diphosphate synthase, type II
MPFDLDTYLSDKKKLIEDKLNSLLRNPGAPLGTLEESMRYSALAGGKRLRPILSIAACEAIGGNADKVLPLACAIEMIHTYSLIHDDLPSMDDDALRRGVPTNHTVFGEAAAILSGDALLTDAFYVMVNEGLSSGIEAETLCEIVRDISKAAGSRGMIRGQAIDLQIETHAEDAGDLSLQDIELMHSLKTGALIEVSVTAGAKIGGSDERQLEQLAIYGRSIGLAFQIVDDVLDVVGVGDRGKESGNDARNEKATYAHIAGIEASKERASELTQSAVEALSEFGDGARPLKEIAQYLGGRKS